MCDILRKRKTCCKKAWAIMFQLDRNSERVKGIHLTSFRIFPPKIIVIESFAEVQPILIHVTDNYIFFAAILK